MKKLKLLLSLSILFFALYSCSEQLEVQDVESIDFRGQPTKSGEFGPNNVTDLDCGISCPLIAGQSIDAGTVTVTNDDENLYVTVFSTYGFQQVDENIKMSIGDIAELPSKRPPAGHFDYKWTEVNGDGTPNTHTFTIELEGLEFWDGKGNCESAETSTPFYIILHADVLTESGSSETAFGGCIDPDTKGAWWYYMEYEAQCCDQELKDSWAFKNPHGDSDQWSFCFLDEGFDNWGWTIGSFNYVERYNKIKLKIDGQLDDTCKPRENTLDIGYVEFWIDNPNSKEIQVRIVIEDVLYSLENTNVYVGEEKYPIDGGGSYTIDPSYFGNSHENLGGVMSDEFTIVGIDFDSFYIMVHAQVNE